MLLRTCFSLLQRNKGTKGTREHFPLSCVPFVAFVPFFCGIKVILFWRAISVENLLQLRAFVALECLLTETQFSGWLAAVRLINLDNQWPIFLWFGVSSSISRDGSASASHSPLIRSADVIRLLVAYNFSDCSQLCSAVTKFVIVIAQHPCGITCQFRYVSANGISNSQKRFPDVLLPVGHEFRHLRLVFPKRF